MSIHGFVLGVILLALVGWCMVQESFKQTRSRYELADLARREEEVRDSLAKLRAEEEALRSPARLATLVRERKLPLVSLGSALPEPLEAKARSAARSRLPGVVLDENYTRAEREVRVASAEF